MPKASLDGRRKTRCSNIPGYEKKAKKGVFDDEQQELANREIALCKEVTRWIDDDRDRIVDLLLSPEGMARGYLSKWVEWAEKRDMPTLPAPTEYANDQERDMKLRANFKALVDHVCEKKVTGLLLTLKGTIERKDKRTGDWVPLDPPNGEVDRVMRIWDDLEEAYADVMDAEDLYYDVLAKLGLSYAHPNEM